MIRHRLGESCATCTTWLEWWAMKLPLIALLAVLAVSLTACGGAEFQAAQEFAVAPDTGGNAAPDAAAPAPDSGDVAHTDAGEPPADDSGTIEGHDADADSGHACATVTHSDG